MRPSRASCNVSSFNYSRRTFTKPELLVLEHKGLRRTFTPILNFWSWSTLACRAICVNDNSQAHSTPSFSANVSARVCHHPLQNRARRHVRRVGCRAPCHDELPSSNTYGVRMPCPTRRVSCTRRGLVEMADTADTVHTPFRRENAPGVHRKPFTLPSPPPAPSTDAMLEGRRQLQHPNASRVKRTSWRTMLAPSTPARHESLQGLGVEKDLDSRQRVPAGCPAQPRVVGDCVAQRGPQPPRERELLSHVV